MLYSAGCLALLPTWKRRVESQLRDFLAAFLISTRSFTLRQEGNIKKFKKILRVVCNFRDDRIYRHPCAQIARPCFRKQPLAADDADALGLLRRFIKAGNIISIVYPLSVTASASRFEITFSRIISAAFEIPDANEQILVSIYNNRVKGFDNRKRSSYAPMGLYAAASFVYARYKITRRALNTRVQICSAAGRYSIINSRFSMDKDALDPCLPLSSDLTERNCSRTFLLITDMSQLAVNLSDAEDRTVFMP